MVGLHVELSMRETVYFYVIVMTEMEPGDSAGSSCEKKL